jgi:hypothetical protein
MDSTSGVFPVIAHIMGLPVEESVLQLVPAGAAMMTLLAVASRNALDHIRRRRGIDAKHSDEHT